MTPLKNMQALAMIHALLSGLLAFCQMAIAEEITENHTHQVSLIELEDADCAQKDGKLIALMNSDGETTFEVWVDRWFMDIQTPDHTKHVLLPGQAPAPLGCSSTHAGDQHWTVHSIKIIKR
jgi:hypothetical protein